MSDPARRNGWELRFFPEFSKALQRLEREVNVSRMKHPESFHQRSAAKRLAVINKLVFDVIPQDPSRAEYRLGGALGGHYKHWFRVKFFQQYRLFFRYHAASRVIIFCWFNDEETKRSFESDDDAYRTFLRMIARGNPPDTWDQLLAMSTTSAQSDQT